MGDKDLEKVLAGISKTEQKSAIKQAQIDRLRELTEKQKRVISEQEGLLLEQKQKIDSMFDVPADVEQLKRLIGEQRAQLNDKDQKLELSYSKVAEIEQELKGQMQTQNIMNKKFESTFSQIGEIKVELAEKNAIASIKDNEIQNLNIKIKELQKISQENIKETSRLNDQIRSKDLELMDSKMRVESELKEQMLTERDESFKKIKDLEAKLLEKELASKEKLGFADQSIKSYDDMKKKYEDLIAKYDEFTETDKKNKVEISELKKQLEELNNYKGAIENTIITFNKIRSLMDTEPMFRVFGIVWDVGEISLSDLKNALGIPTVTMKKYIQTYEKFEILKIDDLGKVSLVDK
jgi:hypothetical protein